MSVAQSALCKERRGKKGVKKGKRGRGGGGRELKRGGESKEGRKDVSG